MMCPPSLPSSISRPTLSQSQSLKIGCTTFLIDKTFADPLLSYCESAGRVCNMTLVCWADRLMRAAWLQILDRSFHNFGASNSSHDLPKLHKICQQMLRLKNCKMVWSCKPSLFSGWYIDVDTSPNGRHHRVIAVDGKLAFFILTVLLHTNVRLCRKLNHENGTTQCIYIVAWGNYVSLHLRLHFYSFPRR